MGQSCGVDVHLRLIVPPRVLTAVSFRTLNGLGILVCSMDGSVAFLDFSQDELGDPLSEEEKVGLWPMSCHSNSEAFLIEFSSYGRQIH